MPLTPSTHRQAAAQPCTVADSKETWVCSYLAPALLIGVGS